MKGNKTISRVITICLAAVMCLSLLAGIAPGASAISASTLSASTETINTGVRIYIKGETETSRFIPTDVNGKEVEPFIWEDVNGGGTTYLPIRAIGELFGVSINWDDSLKCVVIQTPENVTIKGKASADKAAVYGTKQVNATKGIKIVANNYEFTPTDANGAPVNVFLLEDANGGGTTYLPIRAMVKLILGASANVADYIVWNGAERTVTISVPGASLSGDADDIEDNNGGEYVVDNSEVDTTPGDYPTIFLHGLMGWGYEDGISNVVNYWGMTAGNMMSYLRGKGYDVYDASVGPVSSAWDRACELYAQLTGTKVDYGEAHIADKNAEYAALGSDLTHQQYGRDYTGKPLIAQWDADHEINLVGHSFGGPTGRYFISLLAEGSAEERAFAQAKYGADWKEHINPLFLGGKQDWVHSFTSLAGVLNGTTFISTCILSTNFLSQLCLDLGNVMGVTLLGNILDFQLEQFGLTRIPGTNDEAYLDVIGDSDFLAGTDNAFYDLSIAGCNELNKETFDYDNIYYFSYAGNQTRKTLAGTYLPKVSMTPLFTIFSTKMGCYSDQYEYVLDPNGSHKGADGYMYSAITKDWYPNDGMVNTITARFPFGAKTAALSSTKDYKAGTWYWTDIDMDHLDFIGQLIMSKPITTRNFFMELMGNIEATY